MESYPSLLSGCTTAVLGLFLAAGCDTENHPKPSHHADAGMLTGHANASEGAPDGATPAETPVEVPADWQYAAERCGFTFRGPPDMVDVPTNGIDSCVASFRTPGCDIHGDRGWYSDRLLQDDGEFDYVTQPIRVDGRAASLVHYRVQQDSHPYAAGIHIPKVSEQLPGVALTLHAACSTPEAQEEALLMMRTVRFVD